MLSPSAIKYIVHPKYRGPDRRQVNGMFKLIWWMLGIASTVILTGVAAWMTTIQFEIRQAVAFQQTRSERLVTLETIVNNLDKRLTGIEVKLDLLLERKGIR